MRARYDSTSPRDVTRPFGLRRLQIENRLLVDLEEFHDRRGLRPDRRTLLGLARSLTSARQSGDQRNAEHRPEVAE